MAAERAIRAGLIAALAIAGAASGHGQTVPTNWSRVDGIVTETINARRLDSVGARAVGVISAEQAGLPSDFWGNSDVESLAELVRDPRPQALPEIVALGHRIALAQLATPFGTGNPELLLHARIDHLLAAGALEQAEALIDAVGTPTPALFGRAFDIGLLTERPERPCATLRNNPGLAPNMSSRVFCLARDGDWAAAALTVTSAETLGQIDTGRATLLSRFLDPELFEGEAPPPPPATPDTLDFTLREALGLPRATGSLPLAYLHADLDNSTPWRQRVIATERLVRAQAIPTDRLIELYTEGTPAASGGVWVRVAAVQELLGAMDAEDPALVGSTLLAAHAALRDAGLGFALRDLAAGPLAELPLTGKAASLRFALWLLTPDYASLAFDHTPATDAETFLQAVALGDLAGRATRDDFEAAVISGMTGDGSGNRLVREVDQGRKGEAVLKSLAPLTTSGNGDPVALETALMVLRRAGMEDEARRIALEVLLARGGWL